MDLVANNLSYKPDDQYHLNEVSFNFKEGNLYTILGRTLSGKTTLLKTIAGLLTPDSGEIEFDGKNFLKIPVWERNVAMVYQQFINYPHLNVFENIAFPLKQRKMDQSIINEKVMDALKSVGLLGYENRKIQELSGGQQQRVSLARSLVKNAKILLLDEPLVNLDYKLREQLREEFKNLFSKGLADETILIYSTTDPKETMELNGEVIVLDEGKVLQVGPAKEIFENPNSLKVAEISNDPPMNIIEAKISDNQIRFEGIDVDAPQHLSKLTEDGLKIGLRSSDIELNENGHEFEVELAEISNDPPMNIIEAKISDNNIKFEGINLEAPQHLSNLTEDGLKIGLRSSDIELNENGYEFEVELAEISGSETLLHLKRGDTKIIVSIEEVLNFKIHDKVKINFKIDRAYAFNADGKLASSPFGGLNGQNWFK